MKLLLITAILFCQAYAFSVPVQKVKIQPGKTNIQYVESGGDAYAIRKIKLTLEYWSDANSSNVDQVVKLGVKNNETAPNSKPEVVPSEIKIEGKDFSKKHITKEVMLSVKLAAANEFASEFFNIIQLDQKDSPISTIAGGYTYVEIQKEVVSTDSLHTPMGFTYLNAINFDFKNSGGASYVGHLNVFKYNLINVGKKYFGIDCGIMKINYAKGGDSINSTYDYFENTRQKPLDSVKVGMPYYRQYNHVKTTSRNTSMSFYLQPTYALVDGKDFKLFIHAHAEFFVSTWTTSVTIKNLQQITDTIRSSNISILKDSLTYVNKFDKPNEPYMSESSNSKLSFHYGLGITAYSQLWYGGHLFVQTTMGRATSYISPSRMVSREVSGKVANESVIVNENKWFHLTRVELKQDLSSNLEMIVGVNVRGRFRDNPAYAAYIGANLGLGAIRDILK